MKFMKKEEKRNKATNRQHDSIFIQINKLKIKGHIQRILLGLVPIDYWLWINSLIQEGTKKRSPFW